MKLQYLFYIIITSVILCGCNNNSPNTTTNNGLAAASLSGALMKSKSVEPNKKYKRKDCPVCKGKGWYMSGDGIEKIDCQYCEPDSEPLPEKQPVIIKR